MPGTYLSIRADDRSCLYHFLDMDLYRYAISPFTVYYR